MYVSLNNKKSQKLLWYVSFETENITFKALKMFS